MTGLYSWRQVEDITLVIETKFSTFWLDMYQVLYINMYFLVCIEVNRQMRELIYKLSLCPSSKIDFTLKLQLSVILKYFGCSAVRKITVSVVIKQMAEAET